VLPLRIRNEDSVHAHDLPSADFESSSGLAVDDAVTKRLTWTRSRVAEKLPKCLNHGRAVTARRDS